MIEINAASGTLQTLNQRYGAFLQHSSRSVALMVSLFDSFKGNLQRGKWLQVETADLVLPDVNAMCGLNTSLNIGIQALKATKAALNATSNNIANANTPGYTREVPQFSENAESLIGGEVSGGGVNLDRHTERSRRIAQSSD